MMRGKVIIILFLVINLSVAFYQNVRFAQLLPTKWMRNTEVVAAKMKLSMASLEPVSNQSDSAKKVTRQYKPDLSSFAVGQEYNGKVVSLHPFGVFVGIDKGVNVLLPKSKLGKQYDQLKTILQNNPTETVKISLTDISPESGKLAGIIVRDNNSNNANKKGKNSSNKDDIWAALQEKELVGKSFNTTVVGAHDFGLFVKLEEYQVEGLVPVSKLPVKENIRQIYPLGSSISVTVEDVSIESKKMILSAVPKPDVRAFKNFPEEKWTQAVIQNVNSFGLFVRPAGYDVVGLVRRNQIPQDLIYALRNILEIDRRNLTVLEDMFGAGDVVRVRLEKLDEAAGKVEFSMIPRAKVDDLEFDNGDDAALFEEFKHLYDLEAEAEAEKSAAAVQVTPEPAAVEEVKEEAVAAPKAVKARRRSEESGEEGEEDDEDEDEDLNFEAMFEEPKKRARRKKSSSEDSYEEEEEGDEDDEEDESIDYGDEDDDDRYNPLTTLVWWRGKPFEVPEEYYAEDDEDDDEFDVEEGVLTGEEAAFLEEEDEDDEYEDHDELFMEDIDEAVADQFREAPWITESPHMVQGAWKRLLTLDFEVADEAKRKEREREEDRREIEAEIGAMKGFDVEMAKALPTPYLSNFESSKFGCYVDFDQFPEWKEQSEWYKKYEAPLHTPEKIKGGKNNQLELWESDIDEYEKELEQEAAGKGSAGETVSAVESSQAVAEESGKAEEESSEAIVPEGQIESKQVIDPKLSGSDEGATAAP